MTTKIINAVIEKASDGGYGIYCPDLENVSLFGYGLTEEEAKSDLLENLEMFIDESEDKDILDCLNLGDVTFEYQYDISGFFKSFPIFNISELAKKANINPSLLRKYKAGLAMASTNQKKKIELAIHELAKELSAVRF